MPQIEMTRADAQALQDRALAGETWIMWFVSATNSAFPGKAVAWAVIANTGGGMREPSYLMADTLEELRSKLPAGLTRRDRAAVMSANVLETWD